MDKKAKRFRNIISNTVLGLCVMSLIVFALIDNSSKAVGATSKPLYKGESKTNVSLMINVYWGTEYLDDMLETLKENDVKTTFFVGGSWAAENDAMLKKIHSQGHEIGNHGYFHKDHKKLDARRNKEEISVTHQLVKSLIGIDMNLFAPPSGSFSDSTVEGAKELGYKSIMWTYDTIDWRDHDTELIYSRATKNTDGGCLILMHPTKETAAALDRIIKTIKDKGLNITTVTDALKADTAQNTEV